MYDMQLVIESSAHLTVGEVALSQGKPQLIFRDLGKVNKLEKTKESKKEKKE